jgi:hypothetical protein
MARHHIPPRNTIGTASKQNLDQKKIAYTFQHTTDTGRSNSRQQETFCACQETAKGKK